MKKYIPLVIILLLAASLSCETTKKKVEESPEAKQDRLFLTPNDKAEEVFRVLIKSDSYQVVQMKFNEDIQRVADEGGDRYICESLKKLDKIDEAREGVITVSLYPDSGRLQKARPKKITYLIEIDSLLIEDIQRWNFKFPKKTVNPVKFDIRYRVVLHKRLSDEEIMEEVRSQLKERTGN